MIFFSLVWPKANLIRISVIKSDKCFHRSMKHILWENREQESFSLQPPSTKLLNSLSKLYSGNSAPLPSIHQLHLLVLVSLYKKYKVIITYPTYFSSLIPHPPVLLKLNFCSHPPNVHWTCPAFPGHYSKVSGIPVLLQGGVMMDKVNFLLP